MKALSGHGYVSACHAHRGEMHGEETEPTHYNLYRQHSPHHLDYCFVPVGWRIDDVVVGGERAVGLPRGEVAQ